MVLVGVVVGVGGLGADDVKDWGWIEFCDAGFDVVEVS